jgi:hypothetical protein
MLLNKSFRTVLLLSVIAMKLDVTSAQETTYAERLGWPSGTKVVIFHVDDVGMSHNSNMGAIKAVEDGIATSLSIMMPCSWVPEYAAHLKAPYIGMEELSMGSCNRQASRAWARGPGWLLMEKRSRCSRSYYCG